MSWAKLRWKLTTPGMVSEGSVDKITPEQWGEVMRVIHGKPVSWRPMETAPKDGSLLRLLVSFSECSMDDDDKPQATIGMNNFANTESDEWQFAGWCWTHDRFTQGAGTPIGWLPFDNPPAIDGAVKDKAE